MKITNYDVIDSFFVNVIILVIITLINGSYFLVSVIIFMIIKECVI